MPSLPRDVLVFSTAFNIRAEIARARHSNTRDSIGDSGTVKRR